MTNPTTKVRTHSGAKKLIALILAPVLPWVAAIAFAQVTHAATPQEMALSKASWFSNVKLSFSGDSVTVVSDGMPSWMAEKYAIPNAGVVVPESANDVTLGLASKLVYAQNFN